MKAVMTRIGCFWRCGWLLGLAVLACFLVVGSPLLGGEVLDKVVAVVNDEVITQSELDILLLPVYNQYKNLFAGEKLVEKLSEARRSILNQLIEDRLVYQETKRLKIEVTEEEVNARYLEFKSRFKGEGEAEKLLAEQGLTPAKLKERYRQQIAIRKLHQYYIRSKILVTPKDIQDYYQSHLAKFTQKERLKVKTITIRKSEASVRSKEADPVAREKAEEILRHLYAGEKFETLAARYSEDNKATGGGDLGVVQRGDLVEGIDMVLFNLKPGEISPIMETDMGFHIFKVVEKRPRQVNPFDQVRDDIHDFLFRKKSRERFGEWMKDLKKSAYITIR